MSPDTPETVAPDERWEMVLEAVLGYAVVLPERGDLAEAALTSLQAENAELRAERDRLRKALEADAADPCDAAAFYGEDGYDKCLDPEYNDMSGNPTLTRCYSCRARAALRSPEEATDGV